MKQPRAPVGGDDHQIGVTVAVEIARGGVAAALHGQAHRGRRLAERAVEVVAVGTVSGGRREKEIEVAVMIQIREQRLRDGPGIGQTSRGGDVAKRAAARVAEQHSPPRGRDVQVEPSVVVEITERRRDGPIPER